MLALSDEALAVIGASRVAPHARDRWLQRLAAKLDPPPRPTMRQARWRPRQRDGSAIYRLELNVEHVVGALIASGRLSESEAEQHARVEAALAHVVEDCYAHVLDGRARTQALKVASMRLTSHRVADSRDP